MANEQKAIGERSRHRGPAWPFIPLEKAVERVREFYRVHRDRAASTSAANVAWGMGAKSGAGFQTIATLKQYGLMREGTAKGSVQLTDLALRVVQDPRDVSPERDAALQEAAVEPPIFSDLWQKWKAEIPDDASVEYYLVREKSFSEDVAKRLLANYKESLRLADLRESGSLPDSGENSGASQRVPPKTPTPPSNPSPPPQGVKLMEGERIVFSHEIEPAHGVRVLASGEVDASMLDALELYIQLQKKRLGRQSAQGAGTHQPSEGKETAEEESDGGKTQISFFITKTQKAQLREQGYTDEQIATMRPTEAHRALGITH